MAPLFASTFSAPKSFCRAAIIAGSAAATPAHAKRNMENDMTVETNALGFMTFPPFVPIKLFAIDYLRV
jgi:hypothetical protein